MERLFKVHTPPIGCPKTVPWNSLNEEWALRNHKQSLERLNERGGLSPAEIHCNVNKRPSHTIYYNRPTEDEGVACVISLQKESTHEN